jgi:hypothetical protein
VTHRRAIHLTNPGDRLSGGNRRAIVETELLPGIGGDLTIVDDEARITLDEECVGPMIKMVMIDEPAGLGRDNDVAMYAIEIDAYVKSCALGPTRTKTSRPIAEDVALLRPE